MKTFIRIIIIGLALLLTLPAAAQDDDINDLQEDFGLRPLVWDGQQRLTALILGLDRRPSEGDTLLTRTDVIIIASLYPAENRISLLHIPRDIFMAVPNDSELVQVNTLLQDGEAMQDGYGPYWVADVLQYNLGIYIDRYIMLDFSAFITIIDAMGGIEITTGYPIGDANFPNMNFGYDPFYLSAGTHQLSGYNALRFARTRSQDNDYVRGTRQMQVIEAVHQRLREPEALLGLVMQAPSVFRAIRRNIYTDIYYTDAIALAQAAATIPTENIITGVLDRNYTISTFTLSGRRVVSPDVNMIPFLMTEVFGADYNLQP